MLSYSFTRTEETLLIRAKDDRFNCYKYVISVREPFVINFCNGKLDMLETLLRENECNIELQELEDEVLFTLKKPIQLKYKLRKEKVEGGEQTSMILGKIQTLMERLDIMDKRTQDLEEQLELGILVPGYGMGVVAKDAERLMMTFGNWENRQFFDGTLHDRHHKVEQYGVRIDSRSLNYQFNGISLKPIGFLKNLRHFSFGCYDNNFNVIIRKDQCPVNGKEFDILGDCTKLENITIIGTTLNNLNWVKNLKNLKVIRLKDSQELHDIRPLLECPNLTHVDIRECPNIKSIPTFPSHVEVQK